MSDEEYEVESIVEAKVEKLSSRGRAGRNPKLTWKYRVRWKGFTPDDDTWEPIDNFNGSEHIVSAFWERANPGGRNVEDLTQFKLGETFLPLGPPKKKLKRKSTNPSEPSKEASKPESKEVASLPSEKRRRISPEIGTPPRPPKRLREAEVQDRQDSGPSSSVPSSATRPKRGIARQSPSNEIIPDSDEEMNGAISLQTYLSPDYKAKAVPNAKEDLEAPIAKVPQFIEIEDSPEPHDPLFDEPEKKVPDHIARREKPLVRIMDDTSPAALEGSIAVKSRAVRRSQVETSSSQLPSTQPRRAKPGPGRSSNGFIANKSSLLTAAKGGGLKSIKGRYKKEETRVEREDEQMIADSITVDNEIFAEATVNAADQPPSAEALLELAGLDTNAADLPDFDEDPNPAQGSSEQAALQLPEEELPQASSKEGQEFSTSKPSVEFPKHNLFSQFIPTTSPSMFDKIRTTWKQTTIFGPLTLGSDSPSKSQSESSRIYLNLDSSVSIPALLTNTSTSESEDLALKMGSRGTPGKFYSPNAALGLLGTVRSGGASAQVAVDDDATAEEKVHFQHFSARLENGELFVAVAGIQMLVFCSSGTTQLAPRLNLPPALHNVPNAVIVSKVDIENFSGYAEATNNADDRRWSHYVATLT